MKRETVDQKLSPSLADGQLLFAVDQYNPSFITYVLSTCYVLGSCWRGTWHIDLGRFVGVHPCLLSSLLGRGFEY